MALPPAPTLSLQPETERLKRRVTRSSGKTASGVWVVSATECLMCGAPLGFMRRKRNCKICGELFCVPCSSYSVRESPDGARACACVFCWLKDTHRALEQMGLAFARAVDVMLAEVRVTRPPAFAPLVTADMGAAPALVVDSAMLFETIGPDCSFVDEPGTTAAVTAAEPIDSPRPADTGCGSGCGSESDSGGEDGPAVAPRAHAEQVVAWLSLSVVELDVPPTSGRHGAYALVRRAHDLGAATASSAAALVEVARTEVVALDDGQGGRKRELRFAAMLPIACPRGGLPFDLSALHFSVYMASADDERTPELEDLVGLFRVSAVLERGQTIRAEMRTRGNAVIAYMNVTAEAATVVGAAALEYRARYRWSTAQLVPSPTALPRSLNLDQSEPAVAAPAAVDERQRGLARATASDLYAHERLEPSSFGLTVARSIMLVHAYRHLPHAMRTYERIVACLQAALEARARARAAQASSVPTRAAALSGALAARACEMCDLATTRAYLESISAGLDTVAAALAEPGAFKSSVRKKDRGWRFVATNLHVQTFEVGAECDAPPAYVYGVTTFGAPADHVAGFKAGGALQREAKLLALLRGEVGVGIGSVGGGAAPDQLAADPAALPPGAAAPSATDAPQVAITAAQLDLLQRTEVASGQALAAAVSCFAELFSLALAEALAAPDSALGSRAIVQLALLRAHGFVFELESLLSTSGSELGMIGDMAIGMRALADYAFVLEVVRDVAHDGERVEDATEDSPLALPSHAHASGMRQRCGIVPGRVLIEPARGAYAESASHVVRLWLRLPSEWEPALPFCVTELITAGSGACVRIHPIVFTQGINEKQTMANIGSSNRVLGSLLGTADVQDAVNSDSVRALRTVWAARRALLSDWGVDSGPARAWDGDGLDALLVEIETLVRDSHAHKTLEILTKAGDFVRAIGGGRATCCKSSKDRTGMAVTFEQARLLHSFHGLRECVLVSAGVMRSHGVRRENAFRNIGKRAYAFNALQTMLLPKSLKPPAGAGARVRS